MYLDVADSANLPNDWSSYALFRLTVVNQINNKYSVKKGSLFGFVSYSCYKMNYHACMLKRVMVELKAKNIVRFCCIY
jgi:uncharacterized membrane protein